MYNSADEFNLSRLATLRAMRSLVGQQGVIPTLNQSDNSSGIGAVNYHKGETVVNFECQKRRKEIAQLLEALLERHPT